MLKKIILSIGLLSISSNLFAARPVFLKEDLEIGLKKHLACIHDNLNKIISKENIAKVDEQYYDLNKIIERYNFISEQSSYVNYELCDKYSTYVITILENFQTDEKDIEDWKVNYTGTAISAELTDIIKFNKGKEYKKEFEKNPKNQEIENKINKYYDVVIKEDKKQTKDISSQRNIFNH